MRSKGRSRFIALCVAPAAILFFIFMVMPTFNVFRMSLFERGAYSPTETFVGLSNFKVLFKDTKFIVSMQNTILLIVTVTIITFFFAIVFAAILTREKIRGQNFFRIIFYIPNILSVVVIAGICGLSTGKLFLGGIVPGIMCGVAQMIVSYFLAKKEGVAREPGHFSFGPVLKGLWESWPALLMPIIIVGTIMSGIVSPTEAGVIAVVYGLFAGGVIYRELKWEDIKFAFAETVRVSGRIFIVIGAAKLYTVMLTTAGFDKWMANTMLGFSTNPTVILIMILLLFFIVTMFMESIATLTLFMPILYPIATSVGIDPIVMSVLITVVIGIGLVTPPVGMCIYVACDLMDIKVGDVLPTLLPFIGATLVCIALMIAFPQLITVPTLLMKSGAVG